MEKVFLTTKEEIKKAVSEGKTVYADTDGYKVIKDNIGQFLIHFMRSDHYIGLHGAENTEFEEVLNGEIFYYYK